MHHKGNMLQKTVQGTQTSITDTIFKSINTLNVQSYSFYYKDLNAFYSWIFLQGAQDIKMQGIVQN